MTIFKKWFIIPICLISLVCIFYVWLSLYYKDNFMYGTWINGIYCTGSSVEEVNRIFIEEQKDIYPGTAELIMGDGTEFTILLQDVVKSVDYTEPLNQYLKAQSPFLWARTLGSEQYITLTPCMEIDEAVLARRLKHLKPFQNTKEDWIKEISISLTDEGYELTPQKKEMVDVDSAIRYVADELHKGNTRISLSDAACYQLIQVDQLDIDVVKVWNKIKDYLDLDIVYDFGDSRYICIGGKEISDWFVLDVEDSFCFDEDDNPIFSRADVEQYVKNELTVYDTLGKEHTFLTTNGEHITVSGGIYGNAIDQKTETDFLWECIQNKKNATRIPKINGTALYTGEDEIGDTYIEIDMTRQMMYCYKEGELFVETPVVTGNMLRNFDTPDGVNYVYGKQKNRVLRGPNYASFVNYWMPVNGNIGIHDAPWRKEYGGDIYMTSGSHGCINTPYDAMTEIYNNFEVGTPVIMFY